MKKIFDLTISNKKIQKIRNVLSIICLLLGLVSSMIMLFYKSTYSYIQFYIGYTLLKLSILYFACIIAFSYVFDKMKKWV